MKERPILFSGPMVRAILEGRKTQTRRIVKSPAKTMQREGMEVIQHRAPGDAWYRDCVWSMRDKSGVWGDYTHDEFLQFCPYGQPGDRLWVKETHRPVVAHGHGADACDCGDVIVTYAADGSTRFFYDRDIPPEWTIPKAAARGNVSPLFMPRWASRITLEIVSVLVERLQDISEEDAEAEGVDPDFGNANSLSSRDYRRGFEDLRGSINGDGAWTSNPFVWCISFKRVTP